MKKEISKLVVIVCLVFAAISACKKAAEQEGSAIDQNMHDRSIELLRKKVEKEGRFIVMARNIKTESYAVDQNGIKINIDNLKPLTSSKSLSSCEDEFGDPIYGFDESVMESCSLYFLCGSGYKVTTSWLITTPLPLIETGSKGRIRIKDGNGTIVYSDVNITPVSITATGSVDPNFPNSTIYRVTYESDFINQGTFQSGTTLENGSLLATSCSQGPQSIGYLSSYTLFIGTTFSDPCARIDQAHLNPPQSGIYGSIAGCNGFGGCSAVSGYTLPNQHEVEFIAVSGSAVGKTIFLNNWDAKTIIPVSPPASLPADNSINVYIYEGTYTIRYRNNHSCSPAAPWSAETSQVTF
jgi:hypothetical protein